ncbi:methyltransferase FkbM [Candidatus Ruthia magnifica str. Cm (Calyptogena magnifica)]|uniref:Methyltransferase FkbM n=1 Tax=Ruthia magnifica subsp. Calyptogena magnifica TaxID=413404 RepID=A1AXF1_RUTMC|nr:hypothetical protein [Candidatus Ruthturnera calyptogenae]ABL02608.1 methyltransferase FkbM [Candidatus Ruthia magnifica str. Cm (Calyptogena magnifica)]
MRNKFTPQYPLNTAVLFLVFNRLDNTKQVFETIKKAKPPRLYIAADGAREQEEGEREKTQDVRDFIVSNIDWDCKVQTLFQKKNQGCGPNVKLSIDWFFKNEESGVILEDDCVPRQSFFWYCEELLIRYQNDNRIGMISGTNHIGQEFIKNSYTFSKYKACWGWAAWRRSWENMDFDMSWLDSCSKNIIIENMGYGKHSIVYWNNVVKTIQSGAVSAWDWQWYFSLASQGQLSIFPKYNMVANFGFGDNATHTFGQVPKEFTKTKELYFPLSHPKYVLANSTYDFSFENKKIKKTFVKVKKIISMLIKKFLNIR